MAEATRLRRAGGDRADRLPAERHRAGAASGSTQTYGLVVPIFPTRSSPPGAWALQQGSLSRGRVLLLGDAGDDRQREYELIQQPAAPPGRRPAVHQRRSPPVVRS
ncbi:hypothetical protein M8494_29350 [Serratia ureilytica]